MLYNSNISANVALIKGVARKSGNNRKKLMKLESLTLKNFRCYSSITLDLHSQLTILVANNGEGKTTLMDAIRIALWPYVGSFDLAKTTDPANTIQTDDLMLLKHKNNMARQLPCEISLTGDYANGRKTWTLFKTTEATRSRTKEDKNVRQLRDYARNLQNKIRDVHTDIDLPIFSYYGAGRLWQEKPITKSRRKETETNKSIRTFAYKDCLDPASSYKYFKDWYVLAFVKRTQLISKGLKASEGKDSATIEGYQFKLGHFLVKSAGCFLHYCLCEHNNESKNFCSYDCGCA